MAGIEIFWRGENLFKGFENPFFPLNQEVEVEAEKKRSQWVFSFF